MSDVNDGSNYPEGTLSEDGHMVVRGGEWAETELGQHDRWLRQAPDLFGLYQAALEVVARHAQEIQDLRARLASALAEREEALLSIGGVQSDLRKAEFSRDALREALKGAAMTCVSKPGDRRVVIYFGDDLKRAQDCLKVLASRELLAETPTEKTL